MGRERRARFFADTLHDVEDARGDAGLVGEIRHHRASEWRPFGRFDDDGVARRQSRPDLPRRQHERRVPRRDECRDAGRIVEYVIDHLGRIDLLVA